MTKLSRPLQVVLLTLVALVTACASPDHFVASFTAGTLDDSHYVAVLDAAEQWCDATDGECCPAIARDGEGQPVKIVSVLTRKGGTPYTDGKIAITRRDYEAQSLAIHVVQGLPLDTFARAVRHELGHACLAQRDPGRLEQGHLPAGNVMADGCGDQPIEITTADVAYATGR